MDFSFVEPKTLYLIGHLIGIAMGAGGAIISDLLFLKAARDGKITKTEMGFIELGGYAVTFGLLLLIVSGGLLFSLDAARYLASSKFLVKMTVVAVLIANGILLHAVHIPRLKRTVGKEIATPKNKRWKIILIASGALSAVSWVSAVILGAFKSIPHPYESILGVYLGTLVLGLVAAYLMRDMLVPSARGRR